MRTHVHITINFWSKKNRGMQLAAKHMKHHHSLSHNLAHKSLGITAPYPASLSTNNKGFPTLTIEGLPDHCPGSA